jgi:hypothetical protein
MNEQAIKDSYELFKSGGYNKSIDEFKSLIASNPQALNDSYELFKSGGYSKDLDSYKALMGLTAQPVDVQPDKKKVATALPSAASSSGSVSTRPTEPTIATRKPQTTSFGTYGVSNPQSPSAIFKKPVAPEPESILGPVEKDMSVSREVSMRPTQPAMPKIAAPEPSVEESAYFRDRLSTVNTSLISKEEEYVVPQMNYQFGNLGFKFEEAGATGDYMDVTAPNGKQIQISLDNFSDEKSQAESIKLQEFIKNNTPAKGLFALEKNLKEEDRKFNSQKQIDDAVALADKSANDLVAKQKSILLEKDAFDKESAALQAIPESQRNTPEFIKRSNELESRRLALNEKIGSIVSEEESLKFKRASLDKAIGKYSTYKAEQGTWGGAIWNSLMTGYGKISAGMTSKGIELLAEILPTDMQMSPDQLKQITSQKIASKLGIKPPAANQNIEDWKKTLTEEQLDAWEDEVDDYTKKQLKQQILPSTRVGLRTVVGDKDTSVEWENLKKEGFWGGALLGVTESLPAMAGGNWAVRTAMMFSQVSDGIEEEMANNPEFDNVSENEKLLVTLPIGIVGGVLEEFGLKNIKGASGVINKITMSVLGKAGKTVTAKTFKELVENEVESRIAKGLLVMTSAGLAEAETGAAQEAATIGIKEVYNKMKEKEMFDNPDSALDFVKQVSLAGAQEAVGGFVLGVPTAVSTAYSEKGFLKMNDVEFGTFESIANDTNLQNAFISKLKIDVSNGELTTEEAKTKLNDYRNAVGLYRQLPDGLNSQQKKEAMNLLKEKRDLEQYVNGKDKSLVKRQSDRINEIDQELVSISEKKEDYAVQESSTAEGVLRNEEPQVGLQEMGEGNAEGQATPQETIVQEEVTAEPLDQKSNRLLDAIDAARQAGADGIDALNSSLANLRGIASERVKQIGNRIDDLQQKVRDLTKSSTVPSATLSDLAGTQVNYNGESGTLNVSEGGAVTFETPNQIVEIENATPTSMASDFKIEATKPAIEITPTTDRFIDNDNVVINDVEYGIQADDNGNVVGLQLKDGSNQVLTNPQLLVKAEAIRNTEGKVAITTETTITPEAQSQIDALNSQIDALTNERSRIEQATAEPVAAEATPTEKRFAGSVLAATRVVAEDLGKLVAILTKANKNVKVITDKQAMIDFLVSKGITPEQAAQVKGFRFGDKVYINPDLATVDTPIHEFAHIWGELCKKQRPELWKRGISLITKSNYYKDLLARIKANPELSNLYATPEAIKEEALIQAIGERGAVIFDDNKLQLLWNNWVNAFDNFVKKLLGLPMTTDITKIKLSEFLDMAATEVLTGKGTGVGGEMTIEKTKAAKNIEAQVDAWRGGPTSDIEATAKALDELEKSNPELANAVYSTLGFRKNIKFSEKETANINNFKNDKGTSIININNILNKETDLVTKQIIKALTPYLNKDTKIYYQNGYVFKGDSELASNSGYAATIDGEGNILVFDENYLNTDIVLHELMHDFLLDAINVNKDEVLINELTRAFNKAKQDGDLVARYNYAFNNLDEFVSEVFGNRGFRQELSYVKDFKLNKTSNIFESVSDAIKNFLKRKFNFEISNTLLDSIFNAIESTVKNKNQTTPQQISEAYHKAKADGSNPELVKSIEGLIQFQAQQSANDLAKIIKDAIKAKLTKAQIVDILVKRGGLTSAEASQAYNDVKAKQPISITTTGTTPAATTTTVKPKTKFVDGIVNAIEQMLGGNMSPEVKDAITASINKGREAVRTAQITEREMKKQLVGMLKDMTRKGTFTQKEVLPMMRRIAGLNVFNDSAVDNFVNFIVSKFETSEAKAKDREVRSKVKNARKNLKSKVGVARDAMPTLRRLFSLNPRIIPPSVRDAYNELVIEFGERTAVLSLDNINDVMVKADKILQAAINEQNQALLLKNAFDSFQNKVLDANGNIDYAKTIKQMIDDGVISTDDADIMTRQKKLIFESVSRKKTEAEIEAERVANIDTARNMSTDPSDIQTRDERNDAEEFIELINTDAVNNLTPSQAAMLPLILDNINNGWFPSVGKALIASMNGANAGNQLADVVMNRAKAGSIKKALSSVRAMFRKETSAIREYTRGKTLQYIDRALGIKDSRPIYNLVLKPIAEAYSSYKTSYKIAEQRIDKARNNVFKSLGRNGNKLIESSYKQMAYMLQREYLSNKGMKGVVPVVEILDATIKKLKKDNRYADAQTLEQIKKDYVVNGEFDNDKLYNSFNAAEKKCIDVLSEINEELTEKAVYTASVIRGDASPMYRNYVHHDVLVDTNNPLQNYQAATSAHNPSTKAVSLIARTGGAKPLNFDAFSAVKRSSRNVLLDYNMTQTMRTVNKTLSTMADKVNSDPNVTKDQEQIASAIENNVKEVVEDVFMGAYNESTLVDDAIDYITKSGYRSMLAGVRSAAELISNFGAAMYNPKNFFKGVGIVRTSTDFNPVDVMMNVKSSEIERLYSSDPLSGKFVDSSSNTKAGARAEGKTNKVFNKINQIRDYTTRPVRNKIESLADVLISAPDKVVMRPHWFGTFASEFKKQAGVEPDFDKIAANDEAYMKQYKDAMNKARDRADKMSVFIGASDNPFKGILKNTVRDSDKGYIKTYKRFNAFMTRFLVFEYASARAAVTSLVGRGELSRGEGAALLGAITLRMIGYQFLYGILSEQFQNLIIEIFGGEKPEEDEKDGFEKLTQSTLSSIANLVIGRDLGNASKSILNYGVEQFNEAYLEDLRDGREYDKFKDNLVYSPIPLEMGKEGEGKKYGLDDAMISLSGPLSPLLRTTQKALDLLSQEERVDYYARERQVRNIEERIPLEILGHLGFIPFYKDLRGALIKDINKTLKFDESGGGGITKDELKKYDPDYYQEIYGEEDEANAEDAEAKELKEQEKADRDELLKEIYGES